MSNHDLIVHYAAGQGQNTYDTILGYIGNGFSSAPQAIVSTNAINDGDKFLVPFDNAGPQASDWYGHALADTNEIIVKYTYFGDVTLDGVVNSDDLGIVVGNYNKTGMGYFDGDVTFDGIVNSDDLGILVGNYHKGEPPMSPLIGSVPEPGSFLLIGLAGLALGARRRKN